MFTKSCIKPSLNIWFALFTIGLLTLSCNFTVKDPKPVPSTNVHASDLLIDAKSFPLNWEVVPCEPYCDRAERSSEADRSFVVVGVPGNVVQQVFHFGSEEDASAKFQRYEETTSHPESTEILYRSPIADEQYLRCGVSKVPACWAGLRYSNYFVYFYFRIDNSGEYGLKSNQVEPILRAMDEQVSKLFNP